MEQVSICTRTYFALQEFSVLLEWKFLLLMICWIKLVLW